jgi:hypothetical protein
MQEKPQKTKWVSGALSAAALVAFCGGALYLAGFLAQWRTDCMKNGGDILKCGLIAK